MAWYHRDRTRRPRRVRRPVPDGSWDRCPTCGELDLRSRFVAALQVCPHCGVHHRIDAAAYVQILLDAHSFTALGADLTSRDPLAFPDYEGRLARATDRVGAGDAILTGAGRLNGMAVHLGVMRFGFMGGSMGSVVVEKICRLVRRALRERTPLVIVSQSAGARMQEGAVSAMQMAKTSAALAALKGVAIPYIAVLTDPTTGGVLAAHGMQGDVTIAEPGALVGFSGGRVSKEAIGQDLPEGFEAAEFQETCGRIDMIVVRGELRGTIERLLGTMDGGAVTAVAANASYRRAE